MSEHDFQQMDQAMERTLVSHAENLKRQIEAGLCVRCRKHHLIELNNELSPANITFRCCDSECGWFVVYPIRTLGNSERAQRDESLDLVAIAERDFLAKSRAYAQAKEAMADLLHRTGRGSPNASATLTTARAEFLSAATLLESREATIATMHLDQKA